MQRTEAERRAIDRIVGHAAAEVGQVSEMFHEPDVAWYEDCAASEQVLLRRVAATCPGLALDAASRLAGDEDAEVRRLLAFNHPEAPPRLILDAFLACPRQRKLLLTFPGLPKTGLAPLAHHDDPEVRALAAADPTLDEPYETLLTDPDIRVRRAAAANPRAGEPRLSGLLDDPGLAEAAAANPALPAERLHSLLDQAGLPPSTDDR